MLNFSVFCASAAFVSTLFGAVFPCTFANVALVQNILSLVLVSFLACVTIRYHTCAVVFVKFMCASLSAWFQFMLSVMMVWPMGGGVFLISCLPVGCICFLFHISSIQVHLVSYCWYCLIAR